MGKICSSLDTEDLLTLMTSYKEQLLLLLILVFSKEMEVGINRGLCWPVQGVDTLESVCFFHAHLETILISDAINIYLNEDRDKEKLKVWTEVGQNTSFFLRSVVKLLLTSVRSGIAEFTINVGDSDYHIFCIVYLNT